MTGLNRVALGVRYSGLGFEGWQTQPHGNTVQDCLAAGIEKISGERASLICAGRTDTGVHAREQVVHFDTCVQRPLTAWVKGVNAFLPAGVSVTGAKLMPEDFHARFAALSRTYRYYFYCSSVRDPFAMFSTWVHYSLDYESMQKASEFLLGQHDFSSFRASQCQANSPVRTIHQFDLIANGNSGYFEVRGNAFLHHMVRNMIGTLMEVGLGRKSVAWVKQVLEARSREVAGRTWPADGLHLWHIEYPEQFGASDLFANSIVGDNTSHENAS